VREGTWYDTELPNNGRSAGIYAQVFHSPIMAGIEPMSEAPDLLVTEGGDSLITEDNDFLFTDVSDPTYKIWRHEIGVNEIDGQNLNAIQSYFETADFSLLTSAEPKSRALTITAIEPDFVQTGDMSVRVTGRINARSPDVISDPVSFPDVATSPDEQVVFFKEQRREMRFRFESNTVNGDYQMGQVLLHMIPADGRMRS
jgi:hypothetical protein